MVRGPYVVRVIRAIYGFVLLKRFIIFPACFCFLGENEPVSLQSSSTFLRRPSQRKSPSRTPSPCTHRLDGARVRPTALSKAKACQRGAGEGEDFEDGTAVVGEAGEEDDFRPITYSRTIHTPWKFWSGFIHVVQRPCICRS